MPVRGAHLMAIRATPCVSKGKTESATEYADKRVTWRRWMAGRSFTPRANHGMFSAQSDVISLKEHKPVCC